MASRARRQVLPFYLLLLQEADSLRAFPRRSYILPLLVVVAVGWLREHVLVFLVVLDIFLAILPSCSRVEIVIIRVRVVAIDVHCVSFCLRAGLPNHIGVEDEVFFGSISNEGGGVARVEARFLGDGRGCAEEVLCSTFGAGCHREGRSQYGVGM